MDASNGTERQVSTNSMTALTVQEGSRIITTVIPIREEFRCRRAWFFYHDIRALVTSVSACMSAYNMSSATVSGYKLQ